MSSQGSTNNSSEFFPKSNDPVKPNIPIEEQYKKTDQELAAWDQFFSKMTRKITKTPADILSTPPSVPPPLMNQSTQTNPSPKPTFTIKPKTEKISPQENKPITSRFRVNTPTSGGTVKSLTSLIKPTSTPSPTPEISNSTPAINATPPVSKLQEVSPHFNLRPPESIISSKTETSEGTRPKLTSLIQNTQKETSGRLPSEPFISITSVPSSSAGATPIPIEVKTLPAESQNLFSKVASLEIPKTPLTASYSQPVTSFPSGTAPQKISTDSLLEQTLFRSKILDPGQLKCCSVCTQMMPSSKVFICERCKEFSCLRHRKGLFWCETCFSKFNQFHPFYEKIAESLKQNIIKTKGESSGILTLEELVSIFKTLSLSVSSQGLLVIGNAQMKRGICFTQQDILFISFGTNSINTTARILIQNRFLTEEEVEKAVAFQNQHQLSFVDALVTLHLISPQSLQIILNEQAFREIITIARWPESNYKFRPGQVPADVLAKMYVDTAIILEDPPEFKNALMSLFHHMKFILEPGFLLLSSRHGRIGLLVYKSQIVLANFQSDISFGDYLALTQRITQDYWNKTKEMPLSLEEYLVRDKVMNITQINQYRQEYVGQELKKLLQDPEYRCQFYEGEATETDLQNVSILVLGLNLEDVLYDIWPRVSRIPPLANPEEIFTLVFDKNNSDKMVESLHHQLHQSLNCFNDTVRLNEFEKSFLTLALIKSFILNDLKCLEQQSALLREHKLLQEAGWVGECIQKISK